MFNNLLVNGVSLSSLSLCLIGAIISGLICAFSYKFSGQTNKSSLTTISVLPPVVMAAIMLVNGNLGVGLAVAGIFQLTRFRSLPGKAQDIAVVFTSMTCGLACGAGYPVFSILIAIIISAMLLVLSRTSIFDNSDSIRYIKIQMPDYLGIDGNFDEVMKKFCRSYSVLETRTIDLGTVYEFTYKVKLKDVKNERQLIDEIRTMNGNLPIRSTVFSPVTEQL